MKLPFTIYDLRFAIWEKSGGAVGPLTAGGAHGVARPAFNLQPSSFNSSRAFTIIEIAISLAIIGIALVGIIAALPLGLQTQRDNREQTVINQDATVLLEAIRGGAQGLDDLTNYVYAITNYWTEYNLNGNVLAGGNGINNGYTFSAFSLAPGYLPPSAGRINTGASIISLMSTPEYVDINGNPIPYLSYSSPSYSNHVVAYVYSMSGPAVEKPPQVNGSIVRGDSFSYRLLCVNAPPASGTNALSPYQSALLANLHELRLTFEWPQLPSGGLGLGRQTYRTTVAGQLALMPYNGQSLYFYQPQFFASNTNAP
jgi:type II secretory pathway pseudopilin PulG